MSMITEQVKRLRDLADVLELSTNGYVTLIKELREAADTIEQLAAKARGYNTIYYTPIEAEAYQKAFEDIRAEIDEYGSIWVEYQIKGNTDKDIEKIIENVCKQEKQQILEIIDKHDPSKAGKENNGGI